MMRPHRIFALFAVLALSPTAGADDGPGITLFREQIRPILTGQCLKCHGSDPKKGGLDLRRRAAALVGGENGEAIVPGKPDESLLVEKVAGGEMPPKAPLSPEQVAAFRRWIDAGAPFEGEPLSVPTGLAGPPLWSLQPVKRPEVPRTRFDEQARNPIDRFLFAKLEEKGLRPSPPADRLTLLRRVTIDLTGLPPTPEEVDAFLADESPRAYEAVVDRLLASPAYGERWARHWLDVVRFGESNGYEQNHLRANAWPYRDYVIRSINEDKDYPQFISEQLAGDVLASGDSGIEAATGFLVAGVHDTVGIQAVEGTLQQRANDLDDIVSTIGATFLGLTINCARCHDHKFDPIPQQDYYRLSAVVAGVRHGERALSAPSRTDREQVEAAEAERRAHVIADQISDLDRRAREAVLKSQGTDKVLRPAINARRNVEDLVPTRARFVRLTIQATRDGSEPCLDELQVFGPESDENLALAARGAKATASTLLPGYPIHQVHHLNDGRFGNDWSWISQEPGRGWAQVELPRLETISRIIWSRDAAGERPGFTDRLPKDYRVEVSQDGKAWRPVAVSGDRATASEAIPEERLRAALAPADRERRAALAAELAGIRARLSARNPLAYVGQFTAPEPIFRLTRGDVMSRAEALAPAALSQVPGLPGELVVDPARGEPGRRLALARWIADPRNPLTARVLVNRIWQHHFGRGIVGTTSDFGRHGEPPSHPELLDWLASDFMAGGWRLKRLHRLMVTSAGYRQSSEATPEALAADPANRLVGRMPLRRLEAEAVRDSILATSGRLDRRMGGPGFLLFQYKVVNIAIYEPMVEQGPETWRRGIYQQVARSFREDLMASFDCPESAQRTPRRDETTTPLQALSLFNGSFLLQQAGHLADRVVAEAGPNPSAQVDCAFRLAFGRSATASERDAALALIARQGLPALGRALLNANEFLYY